MVRKLIIGFLFLFAIVIAATGAPEPLQRDTQTKAMIQTQLDMKGVTLTLGSLIVSDAAGIRVWDLGSTNGTRIGDTGDKIGFLGATPVVRPASTADLRQSLINLGLYTTGGASPLNLNGGALTAAAITGTTGTFTSTMGITGNTTIGGTLGVTGTSTLATVNATIGNFSGALDVNGSSTFAAGSFSGTLSAADNVTFESDLEVDGSTSLNGGMTVIGTSAIQGLTATTGAFSGLLSSPNVSLTGGTISGIASYAGGSMDLTGNGTVGGTLGVIGGFTGSSGTFSTTLGVTGNATVGGTLGVTGATAMAALSATTGTFSSTLGVTGALTGTTSSFSSTVRGTVQDKGGAVYHVKAYGVVGDGATNDTAAIQALQTAVKAAGGGIIQFDAGTFIMNTSTSLTSSAGITIRGVGKGATIIKSTVAVGTPANSDPIIFLFTSCSNVLLEGITFDGNNIVTTQPNCSLVATVQTPLQVHDCEFINFKRNCLAVQSTSLEVTGCRFNRTTTEGSYVNLAILVYSNISRSGPIIIDRNEISGSGVEIDADDIKITNNDIDGFAYGAGIAIDFGASNGVISGNTITGGAGPDVNGFYCKGIESYGTPTTISANLVHGNNGGGIFFGAKYHTLTGNVIWDNGTGANQAPGILNNYQGSTLNGSYSTISGNIVRQITGANQTYGYQDGGGAGTTNGIRFSGNSFVGNATGAYFLAATSTDYIFDDPLRFSIAWTPGLVSAGTEVSISTTASGVAVGDFLQYSLSPMPNYGFILHVYCYTANTITAVLYNPTGSPQTLGASTLYLKAEKRPF